MHVWTHNEGEFILEEALLVPFVEVELILEDMNVNPIIKFDFYLVTATLCYMYILLPH